MVGKNAVSPIDQYLINTDKCSTMSHQGHGQFRSGFHFPTSTVVIVHYVFSCIEYSRTSCTSQDPQSSIRQNHACRKSSFSFELEKSRMYSTVSNTFPPLLYLEYRLKSFRNKWIIDKTIFHFGSTTPLCIACGCNTFDITFTSLRILISFTIDICIGCSTTYYSLRDNRKKMVKVVFACLT